MNGGPGRGDRTPSVSANTDASVPTLQEAVTGLARAHGGPPAAGRIRACPEDFQVTELMPDTIAHDFVVVSRNIDYSGAVFGFAEYGAYDVCMFLGPVGCFLDTPEIDNITHQEEIVSFEGMQEMQ